MFKQFKSKKIFSSNKAVFFDSIIKRNNTTLFNRKKTGLLKGEDVITSEGLTKSKIEDKKLQDIFINAYWFDVRVYIQ